MPLSQLPGIAEFDFRHGFWRKVIVTVLRPLTACACNQDEAGRWELLLCAVVLKERGSCSQSGLSVCACGFMCEPGREGKSWSSLAAHQCYGGSPDSNMPSKSHEKNVGWIVALEYLFPNAMAITEDCVWNVEVSEDVLSQKGLVENRVERKIRR